MIEVGEILQLPDADALADLATFIGRALRADPDGAVRLVATGDVLAAYVSPLHGGGPVVLGLRTMRLARASDLDATVLLAALADRLSALTETQEAGDPDGVAFEVPVRQSAPVAWAGISPPRRGWEPVAALEARWLAARAASGIAEVVTGAPAGSGAAAVAALRARIWGRPLTDELPGLPVGAAFAAEVLGFLDAAQPVAVLRRPPWWRLSTSHGHVLTRRPGLSLA